MQGVGGVRSLCVSCSGGVLQECYVTKRGYQLERDKLLRGVGGVGGSK